MVLLIFFITISLIVSFYDIKYRQILDSVILPALLIEFILVLFDKSYNFKEVLLSVTIITMVIIALLATPFAFGGGDLRYALFCSPLITPKNIGWFLLFAGSIHILLLLVTKKKTFAFIPSMFLSTLIVYIFQERLWKFVGVAP